MITTDDHQPAPLPAHDVTAYLLTRGIDAGPAASVTELTDGVSALVYLVESPTGRFVVKQALPELRVSARWVADPHRNATEAAALQLAASLTPGATPELLDVDEERCALVMTAAPPDMVNLRRRLLTEDLSGSPTLSWFFAVGATLGTWHEATWHQASVAERFDDDAAFDELRLTPFYRAVRAVHPEVAPALEACLQELESTRECFVHGDYSPKNVLTSAQDVWVLDFEVARYGAAVFDLAFLGHHLLLKAIVRPAYAPLLRRAFDEFRRAYASARARPSSFPTLGHHLAALMLARVDGVSRASYLSRDDQAAARALALRALSTPNLPADQLWDQVVDHAREVTRVR